MAQPLLVGLRGSGGRRRVARIEPRRGISGRELGIEHRERTRPAVQPGGTTGRIVIRRQARELSGLGIVAGCRQPAAVIIVVAIHRSLEHIAIVVVRRPPEQIAGAADRGHRIATVVITEREPDAIVATVGLVP